MAFNALSLPAYRASVPDWSQPLGQVQNALSGYAEGLDKAYKAEQGRKVTNALASGDYKGAMAATDDPAMALNIGTAQRHVAADGRAQKQFDADWFGKQAMAIANLPEGPQRAAAWQSYIAKHPDQKSLDPAHMDPRTGPQMVAAEYGQYKDALEQQIKRAQLGHMATQDQVARAQLQQSRMQTPEYRAGVAGQYGLKPGTPEYNTFVLNGTYTARDPMEGLIQDLVRRSMPAPQQHGGIQRQSNDGPTVPQTGIVKVADTEERPSGTTAGSMFGNMPPEQKRAMAEVMLLSPKTKAMGEQFIKDLEQGKLGKEGRNEVDKKALASSEGMARLQAIEGGFKPEYLNIDKRLGFAWNAAKEKYLGGKANLTPQQKAELDAYTGFRADAVDNLSQYIKEITGSAMGIEEAKRIIAGMPNAGSGVFDGDSPTEFEAKMRTAVKRVKMAHARMNYAQKNGVPWASIGMHQMGDVVQRRTDELQNNFQRQGLQGDDLKAAVTKALKQDFGI